MGNSFEYFTQSEENEDPRIEAAVEWIRQQMKNMKYGEVGFTLFLHDGEIKNVDKSYRSRER